MRSSLSCWVYLLLWFWDFTMKNLQDFIKIYRALIKDFTIKNLQDFIKIYRALIKDIFPVAGANPENLRTDSEQKHKKSTSKSTLNMSTQLSSRTWPIRSVQVQLGSVAHPRVNRHSEQHLGLRKIQSTEGRM